MTWRVPITGCLCVLVLAVICLGVAAPVGADTFRITRYSAPSHND